MTSSNRGCSGRSRRSRQQRSRVRRRLVLALPRSVSAEAGYLDGMFLLGPFGVLTARVDRLLLSDARLAIRCRGRCAGHAVASVSGARQGPRRHAPLAVKYCNKPVFRHAQRTAAKRASKRARAARSGRSCDCGAATTVSVGAAGTRRVAQKRECRSGDGGGGISHPPRYRLLLAG